MGGGARPDIGERLRRAVLDSEAAVALTTAVLGGGGFGKSTLARMLVHEPQVRDRFRDGVVRVTLGERLTDPEQAGGELGRCLGDRRVLVDVDVMARDQARHLLLSGVDLARGRGTDEQAVRARCEQVLTATGCWPVLLGLVNAAVRADVRAGAGVEQSLGDMLGYLSGENVCSIRIEVHPGQVVWTSPGSFSVAGGSSPGDSSPRLFALAHTDERPST